MRALCDHQKPHQVIGGFRENSAETLEDFGQLIVGSVDSGCGPFKDHERGHCTSFARTGDLFDFRDRFTSGDLKFSGQLINAPASRAFDPNFDPHRPVPQSIWDDSDRAPFGRQDRFLRDFDRNAIKSLAFSLARHPDDLGVEPDTALGSLTRPAGIMAPAPRRTPPI